MSTDAVRMTAWHGFTLAQRNVRRIFRAPRAIFFAVLQPLMFVLLFAYIFAGPFSYMYGGGYMEYLLAGVCAQAVVFGGISTAVGMAYDMRRGALDRLRSLPIPRSSVLLGRTGADLVRSAVTVAVTTLACLAMGWRTDASPLSVAAGFALLLLLGHAFSWIGAFLGLRLGHVESASTAGMLVAFPVVLLSGAFVPVSGRAGVIGVLAEWNPVTATATAARAAWGNPNPVPDGSVPLAYPALTAVLWSAGLLAVFVPAAAAALRGMARQ